MTTPGRYLVPAAVHRAEDVVSRSRFIATVGPAATRADAEALVARVRAEFPDATHNAYAFVAGPPGSTAQVGSGDDGEVHGTAGRPMLTVLLHAGVGDVCAVVTRWYGGTKLGTGGLVRAYGGALQLALATLPTVEKVERTTLAVTLEHAAAPLVRQLLPAHEAEVIEQAYGADVRLVVRLPAAGAAAFREAIGNATRGRGIVAEE